VRLLFGGMHIHQVCEHGAPSSGARHSAPDDGSGRWRILALVRPTRRLVRRAALTVATSSFGNATPRRIHQPMSVPVAASVPPQPPVAPTPAPGSLCVTPSPVRSGATRWCREDRGTPGCAVVVTRSGTSPGSAAPAALPAGPLERRYCPRRRPLGLSVPCGPWRRSPRPGPGAPNARLHQGCPPGSSGRRRRTQRMLGTIPDGFGWGRMTDFYRARPRSHSLGGDYHPKVYRYSSIPDLAFGSFREPLIFLANEGPHEYGSRFRPGAPRPGGRRVGEPPVRAWWRGDRQRFVGASLSGVMGSACAGPHFVAAPRWIFIARPVPPFVAIRPAP
jgi:hypothetical protein